MRVVAVLFYSLLYQPMLWRVGLEDPAMAAASHRSRSNSETVYLSAYISRHDSLALRKPKVRLTINVRGT